MNKFSDIILEKIDYMEFLSRTLSSAQIYYLEVNDDLADIIKNAKIYLESAIIDLTFDLKNKINQTISDNNDLVNKINNYLEEALREIRSFPQKYKVVNFDDIELQIISFIDFIEDYKLNSNHLLIDLDLEEKKSMSNKILNIRNRRII